MIKTVLINMKLSISVPVHNMNPVGRGVWRKRLIEPCMKRRVGEETE